MTSSSSTAISNPAEPLAALKTRCFTGGAAWKRRLLSQFSDTARSEEPCLHLRIRSRRPPSTGGQWRCGDIARRCGLPSASRDSRSGPCSSALECTDFEVRRRSSSAAFPGQSKTPTTGKSPNSPRRFREEWRNSKAGTA